MKQNIFKSVFLLAFATTLLISTYSQSQLQQIDQVQSQQINNQQSLPTPSDDSPFKHGQRNKRHHSGDVKKGHREQNQQQKIYKPFPTKDEQEQDQNDRFADMMFWGLTIGSVFLAVVLCKTCMKKRGRCQRRRQFNMNQANMQQSNNPYNHYVQRNYNPIVRVPIQGRPYDQIHRQVPNTVEIDNQISKYEAQLNQLKQLKEKTLKDEQLRKNQQKQAIQKIQFHNQNYGPRYYGDKPLQRRPYHQGTDYSLSSNQPFQVQGIDPILPRRRVNSINNQIVQSQRNGVYYRNGIPIGKPLNQQDNDSSFASQYPQI